MALHEEALHFVNILAALSTLDLPDSLGASPTTCKAHVSRAFDAVGEVSTGKGGADCFVLETNDAAATGTCLNLGVTAEIGEAGRLDGVGCICFR